MARSEDDAVRSSRALRAQSAALRARARAAMSGVRRASERLRSFGQIEARVAAKRGGAEPTTRATAGVAHDLNNLLVVMHGSTDTLRTSLDEDDPRLGELDELELALTSAAELTRQLSATAPRPRTAPVDLDQLLATREPLLRRLVGDAVSLRVELGHGGSVRVDSGQLCRILVNLVVNARDATPRGGDVAITTAALDLARTVTGDVGEVHVGHWSRLSVTDTGRGMDADTADHIFDPFFTTKAHDHGGLGLSISNEIVRQSGGSIVVYTAPRRGSTFEVYLPRA